MTLLAPLAGERRLAWVAQARCRTADPDELFVTGAAQKRAAVICRQCDVDHPMPRRRPRQPGRVRSLGRYDRAPTSQTGQTESRGQVLVGVLRRAYDSGMTEVKTRSKLSSWAYALRTTNPPPDVPVDVVTRWLVVTRAAVLPMTLVSGLVAALLADRGAGSGLALARAGADRDHPRACGQQL